MINPMAWALIIRAIIIKPVLWFIKVVLYLMQLPFKGLKYVWTMFSFIGKYINFLQNFISSKKMLTLSS